MESSPEVRSAPVRGNGTDSGPEHASKNLLLGRVRVTDEASHPIPHGFEDTRCHHRPPAGTTDTEGLNLMEGHESVLTAEEFCERRRDVHYLY